MNISFSGPSNILIPSIKLIPKMFRTMFASRSILPSPLHRPHSSISNSFDEDLEENNEKIVKAPSPHNGQIVDKSHETECLKFIGRSIEIAEHGMREYEMSGQRILAVKLFSEVHLLQGECPNCGARLIQGCLSQQRILCPQHGSVYNIRTGQLEGGIGFHSLRAYENRTLEGNVFVKFPLHLFGRRFELPMMMACPRRYDYLGIGNKPIVIVGAGIAGISCAFTLREKGYSGRLLLLSREQCAPYDRKSLSKRIYVEDASSSFDLFPNDSSESVYDRLSLELVLGSNLREVSPNERMITVEANNGQNYQMKYAYLVLAMGATPKKLALKPEVQKDVLYLRTLDDAKKLAAESAGKSVAIVGAGMLGIELAGTLRKTAKNVTLFGKFASSLGIFGESVRNEILDWLHENGVNVMRNSSVYDFERCGNRVQICFNEISTGIGLCAIADKLVGAIGIMPSTSNLMKANLRMDAKGFVLVNGQMRTSQPGILACGDCASVPLNGAQRFNWSHWQMAQHQGKLAAQTILGIREENNINARPPMLTDGHKPGGQPDHYVPLISLDLPNRHLTYSGWPWQQPEERLQFGSIRDNNYIGYHFKNGNVVAVVNCGPTNLAIQFMDIFAKDIKISKERVLRNHHHNWTNYSAY